MSAFFCAICAGDITTPLPLREPIGKNGAMVNVCRECALEPAHERQHAGIPYQPESFGGLTKLVAKAQERIIGTPSRRPIPPMENLTPGWVVVRVPRLDGQGKQREEKQAFEVARRRHPHATLHYLGGTSRWFLFERPDPMKKTRGGVDPISDISKYRRSHGG